MVALVLNVLPRDFDDGPVVDGRPDRGVAVSRRMPEFPVATTGVAHAVGAESVEHDAVRLVVSEVVGLQRLGLVRTPRLWAVLR